MRDDLIKRTFPLVRGSGQGRGRTADLPIFRTPVQCPSLVGTVHELRRNSFAVAGGRPRTNVNETEMETAPGALTIFDAVDEPGIPAR